VSCLISGYMIIEESRFIGILQQYRPNLQFCRTHKLDTTN